MPTWLASEGGQFCFFLRGGRKGFHVYTRRGGYIISLQQEGRETYSRKRFSTFKRRTVPKKKMKKRKKEKKF